MASTAKSSWRGTSILIQIEGQWFHVCAENDWQILGNRVVDSGSIQQRSQNSNVSQSSQHNQNVRAIRRSITHLHYLINSDGWATLSAVQTQLTSALSQSCRLYEANLYIDWLASQQQNYSQRSQTIEHCFALSNIMLTKGVIKLCDFGWSVHLDNKMRTTFCGTPLYVCP